MGLRARFDMLLEAYRIEGEKVDLRDKLLREVQIENAELQTHAAQPDRVAGPVKHVVVLAPGDTVELCWQVAGAPSVFELHEGPTRCGAHMIRVGSPGEPVFQAEIHEVRCELREGHEGPHYIGPPK